MSSDSNSGGFEPHERQPLTGNTHPDDSEAMIELAASKLDLYNDIHIKNVRHDRAMGHYRRVMSQVRRKGRPLLGGRILGPSGSGKTRSATFFQSMIRESIGHGPELEPVIIAPLDRACTARRLYVSILTAMGDSFANAGSEDVLKQRTYSFLERNKTRLLIIDETQHLAFRSTENNSTTDTLKRFLDDAVCPLVMTGTDEAASFLNKNRQLSNRLMPPCDMKPLSRKSRDDRTIFANYVNDLDIAMFKAGLTLTKSDLANKRTLSCLFAITGGVLGRVSYLMRVALEHAVMRGASHIEIYDLSEATTMWAVEQEFIEYNPFVSGVLAFNGKGGRDK